MPVTINGSGTIDLGSNLKLSNSTSTDSNTLDDYEEGTWTPEFQGSNGNPLYVDNELLINRAHYVKIGRLVYFYCYITNDASFSYGAGFSGTTKVHIGGLPFTVSNENNNVYDAISVGYFFAWTGWSASYTPMGTVVTNTNQIQLFYATTNGCTDVTASFLYNPNSAILVSGHYLAAS
jgi:hypothetical protein